MKPLFFLSCAKLNRQGLVKKKKLHREAPATNEARENKKKSVHTNLVLLSYVPWLLPALRPLASDQSVAGLSDAVRSLGTALGRGSKIGPAPSGHKIGHDAVARQLHPTSLCCSGQDKRYRPISPAVSPPPWPPVEPPFPLLACSAVLNRCCHLFGHR